MPIHHCTEAVCGHVWSAPAPSDMPRCPRCGGLWVRRDSSVAPRNRKPRRARAGLIVRPDGALLYR